MNYEKVNITDLLAIAALTIALVMAIYYGRNDLAMNIASGIIGYIGGTRAINAQKEGEQK